MNQQPPMPSIAYIISQNFSAQHIEYLIKELNHSKIPIQLQKDHDSLGVVLDRRYFIVVDNLSGSIALGPWFSSLLLFIVGYPRKGSNKKNHYCTTPRQVISKYKQFCGLPGFVRKSFLSSTITQKSVLKSVISSSIKSNQIAQSQETSKKNKITNQNQITIIQNETKLWQSKIKAQENSKLFLFLSVRDTLFNKWLLKIATNNRKKYVLIQSLQDLSLMLTVNRGVQNFLLIKDNQYQTIPKQNLDQLKIIMYTDKKYQGKQENVIDVCLSQVQIVDAIRKIGFQILPFKDTDKSIIKYDNPFAKQMKSNTSKKIIWDCQKQNQKAQVDLKKQGRSITNKQKGHLLNQSEPLTKLAGSDCSFQSKVYTILRSTSTESAPQGKNKRISIQTDLRHNQEEIIKGKRLLEYNLESQPENRSRCMSTLTSNQNFLNSPVPITLLDDSTKSKQQKAMSQKQPISQTCEKVEQKKIRVKRIRYSQNSSKINESKKSQSNEVQSVTSNTSSLRTSKIFKKKVCQPDLFMSTCEQKDVEDKNTRMKRSISISSKTSLAFQQSDRQSDGISLTGTIGSKKDEKVRMTRKKCSLKKSIIEAQQKLINNTKHQLFQTLRKQYQIFNNVQSCSVGEEKKGAVDDHILLWKQFNFQIENNKNYLKQELKNKKFMQLSDIPFYTLDQFRRCIEKNKEKKIFILMDEEEMYSYLKVLNDSKAKKQALGLYVFQKMQKNQNSFISGIKTILKTNIFKELRPIVKPVLFNQYFDEGLQAAKQIISIFVHHLK